MKFVITEEEKKSIKNMYGLVVEQEETTSGGESTWVSIEGMQPYPDGTDWDLVHGIAGSKKLDDDLESRVTEKLKENKWRVSRVNMYSFIRGDKVVTNVAVNLISVDNNPDIAFTTRGSIGDGYEQRHDQQVSGLVERLNSFYKGSTRVYGPIIRRITGTSWEYKQSFFVVSKQPINQSGKSPFIQNGIYKGVRSVDKKEYFITIEEIGEPDKDINGWFIVNIQGPGSYEGDSLVNGISGYELHNTSPNTLSGNGRMGDFENLQKVSSKPVEAPKPAEPVKAVTSKPVEAPKPETPKPAEPVKTVAPKPAEAPKVASPKPSEVPKIAAPKPSEPSKAVTPKPAELPKTDTPAKRANILTINPNDF